MFEKACETLIHLLGGIGFTWEHDAHLYWRRAKVDRLLLGDESEHLAAVALRSLAAEALRVAQGAGNYLIKLSGANNEENFGTRTGIAAMKIGTLAA